MSIGKMMAAYCYLRLTHNTWICYQIGPVWYVQAGPMLYQFKDGWTAVDMLNYYGPSLQRSSKMFHDRYGSDEELLREINLRLS
jgi:hypothetical protein